MLTTPQIARTAFSKFEAGVARLLRRNNILTPPKLLITEELEKGDHFSVMGAFQIEPHHNPLGTIEIGRALAALGENVLTMGIYGHEMGHLLGKHRIGKFADTHALVDMDQLRTHQEAITTRWRLGQKIGNRLFGLKTMIKQPALEKQFLANEKEADRAMTHLLGSKELSHKFRRAISEPEENTKARLRQLQEKAQTFTDYVNHEILATKTRSMMLPLETAIENIDSVNLQDRSWIDRLIAEREEMIAAGNKQQTP